MRENHGPRRKKEEGERGRGGKVFNDVFRSCGLGTPCAAWISVVSLRRHFHFTSIPPGIVRAIRSYGLFLAASNGVPFLIGSTGADGY